MTRAGLDRFAYFLLVVGAVAEHQRRRQAGPPEFHFRADCPCYFCNSSRGAFRRADAFVVVVDSFRVKKSGET